MAERYDAGIVTAYGAAVRGGYTGTYDEFCAQQAGYAQNAAAVEQAKSDAQTAAQAARDVADSIPADYSQMSADVTQLQADTNTLKEDFKNIPINNIALDTIALTNFTAKNGKAISGYSTSEYIPTYSDNANAYAVEFEIGNIRYIKYKVDTARQRIGCAYTPNVSAFAYDTSSAISGAYANFVYDSDAGYVTVNVGAYKDLGRTHFSAQVSIEDKMVVNLTPQDGSNINVPISQFISGTNLKDGTVTMDNLSAEVKQVIGVDAKTIVNVASDGTGDYSSLTTAIKSLQPNTKYEIRVHEGTYNIGDEWTTEELDNANYPSGFYGLTLPVGCDLIGVGEREKILITAQSNSSYTWGETWTHISTINVLGDNKIENVTIKAKGLRYAIHDDFSTSAGKTNIYKNCGIERIGDASTSALGMGSHNDETVIIENCYIQPVVGLHGHNPATAGATLKITNSIITSALMLNDYNTGYSMPIDIVNSTIGFVKYSRTGHTSQYMKINLYGCDAPIITNIADIVYDTNGTVRKICTANIAKGKAVKMAGASNVGASIVSAMSSADTLLNFYGIAEESISASSYGNQYYFGRIIRTGYVSSLILGITGLSVGDTVGLISGNIQASNENVIGVVDFMYDDVAYIRITV